jgi:hypothetical protein
MISKKWCIQGSLNFGKWIKQKEQETGTIIKIAGIQTNWVYYPIISNLSQWSGNLKENQSKLSFTEITFEEFEKYILNKQTDVPEDYKYLTTFLKKLKIK